MKTFTAFFPFCGQGEAAAVVKLAAAARWFGPMKPRKNVSGSYGAALAELLEAGRTFAAKSDEQWAAEVAALKDLADHLRMCRECGDMDVLDCEVGAQLWRAAMGEDLDAE